MFLVVIIALGLLSLRLFLDYINAIYYRQKIEELLEHEKTRFIDTFSVAMAKELLRRKAG